MSPSAISTGRGRRRHPRHAHLLPPIRRTLHSRHPGVKIRLKLARIQRTPDALGSVVVNRQLRPTFRASPAKSFLMNGPDIDASTADIQHSTVHFPGLRGRGVRPNDVPRTDPALRPRRFLRPADRDRLASSRFRAPLGFGQKILPPGPVSPGGRGRLDFDPRLAVSRVFFDAPRPRHAAGPTAQDLGSSRRCPGLRLQSRDHRISGPQRHRENTSSKSTRSGCSPSRRPTTGIISSRNLNPWPSFGDRSS